MRKILLLLCITVSLFAEMQRNEYAHEMSLLIGDSENGRYQKAARSTAFALEYQYNGFDFPIKPEIELVYSQNILIYYTSEETKYLSLMANGVYEIPYTELLTPYLQAGLGYSSYKDLPDAPQSSLLVDAGGGLKLHLTDKWAIKVEFLYTQQRNDDNILILGGLNYSFGRKGVTAESVTTDEYQHETIVANDEKPQEKMPPAETTQESALTDEPQTTNEPETSSTFIAQKEPAPAAKTAPLLAVYEEPKAPYIAFGINSARLTKASKESLANFAEVLNREENRQNHLLIIGHTDADGSRADNATLSLKRAVSVRIELIADGIDPKRITIDGMGETQPLASNLTASGKEQNRRVVISVKPDQENSLNTTNNSSDTTQE